MIMGLPEKLRNLRLRRGFSQKKLAEMLGVSPSVVSAYETGERTPSVEILLAVSSVYGVSTDFLLGRPASSVRSDGLTEKQITALNALIEAMKKE